VTTFRHIDTSGLPAGYDVADLIESGADTEALRAWCRARLVAGPIRTVKPVPATAPPAASEGQTKSPAAAGGQGPGRGVVEPGRETSQAQARTPKPAVSTPAPASNVVQMPRPEPEPLTGIPPEYSDDALADNFSKRYGDQLAYVATWGRWMLWDQGRWKYDDTLRTRDLARGIARETASEASTRIDLGKKAASIANVLGSSRTIAAIETIARTDRRHAASAQQFDRDPWMLNTPGGIVDLRTGVMRPARKDDYATKVTRATPGGRCPTWLEFLQVATDGDTDLIAFMRRMAGYCLTGITREHAFFFVYGTGGNGKGTFLNTLDWIFNDYAKAANMEMFIEQKFASHPTDVAGLMGARLVTAQETEEGKRWNEQRLKAFTGGDPITARFMRQDEFTFLPQFKLVFAGNHKPMLRNVDEAIRRRLFLIPFTVTPKHKDPHLYAKLRDEADGILQWCVEGCLDWQDNMLAPPDRVLATTQEYFESQDTLGTFINEECEPGRYYQVQSSALYARYKRWAEAQEEYVLPQKRWRAALEGRGMASFKSKGVMVYEGVRLRTEGPPDDYAPL
jgi:putative DNA primase/helicase